MNILIGVQARTASTRLPNKVLMYIGAKQLLQHVLDHCEHAIKYLKSHKLTAGANVKLGLLIPHDDNKIKNIYGDKYTIIGGDPDDVLSRYIKAAEVFNSDIIVRITADCFWLPSHLIAKHVRSAIIKGMDYTTNVLCRTWPEGYDVQVVSRRLLHWVSQNAKTDFDKEHVLTVLDPDKKFPFTDKFKRSSICHILSERYEAHLSTSINTLEDFEKTRELYGRYMAALDYGRNNGIACL